jgi:hypothetical protein
VCLRIGLFGVVILSDLKGELYKMAKQATAGARKRRGMATAIKKRFVKGLLMRKEAAPMKNGELPHGATHEIVKHGDGAPSVRRRRFSLS